MDQTRPKWTERDTSRSRTEWTKLERMKMSTVKLFVGAVVEITVLMSFGLVVTSARGGTMGSV